VVELDGGLLVHTGLPNPGISKVVTQNRGYWERLPIPIIAHVVVNTVEEVYGCMTILEREETISAVELGLSDEISAAETEWYIRSAAHRTEKPLIVRMPFSATLDHFDAAIDAGAASLVICAGGIHSPQDARDYLEAGAVAVQVDSVTWVQPGMLDTIARDLGGMQLTQPNASVDD
jgi:dihydroorotate dehydrogenase